MSEPDQSDWWKIYFDDDFFRIYSGLLPPEEARETVDAVIELAGLAPGARVLDLACGWGRHAAELRAAGVEAVGLDRSLSLLQRAASASAADRLPLVCADLRELPFRHSFDAVVCFFSSLGYFSAQADELRVLNGVREALRPDGIFVLETVHRDAVVRDYVERDWWEGDEGETIFVEREFDAVRGVTSETLRWTDADGNHRAKHHSARIRSATEWRDLLELAGLNPIAWYGGWDGSSFDQASDLLIVFAVPAG